MVASKVRVTTIGSAPTFMAEIAYGRAGFSRGGLGGNELSTFPVLW